MTDDILTREPEPPAADRPGHYRLSTETWAEILTEYVAGATAPYLARKYRVGVHALRRRAGEMRMTKRDHGDRQVMGQAAARAAELEELRLDSPEARVRRLFEGLEGADQDADDPDVLMRQAARAAGRAMRQRLWAEAKTLAGLAEHYGKLAAQAQATRNDFRTVETMPIQALIDAVMASDERIDARLRIDDRPGRLDPDQDMKWAAMNLRSNLAKMREAEAMRGDVYGQHIDRLEAMLRGLGQEPPERPSTKVTLYA